MHEPGFGFGPSLRHILAAVDFRTATIANGVFALPAWLAIACATTLRTAQTSASTLRIGLGANAARARSVDGAAWGLSVESGRTNLLTTSDAASGGDWNPGTMTRTASVADPAGGTAAVENSSAGSQYSNYLASAVSARAISAWARLVSGSSPSAHFRHDGTGGAIFVDVTSSAWTRLGLVYGANTAGNANFETRDIPTGAGALAGARVFRMFGVQAEASVLYPSSYIPTLGVARARAADVLSLPSPTLVAPGGFFDVTLVIAPNYTQAEQSADQDLLYFGANDRAFLKASDHKIYLRVGGADVASSALTWSREQALTIRAVHGRGGRALVVSGATSGDGSATGSAAPALTLPATAYLLGDSSGAQECADLRACKFRKAA